MDTVFPVEMVVHNLNGQKSSTTLQGFTRDVGRGGLRLEYHATQAQEHPPITTNSKVDLAINVPFRRDPIEAESHVAWCDSADKRGRPYYTFGVAYDRITPQDAGRLIRYARMRRWLPRAGGALILCLLISVFGLLQYQKVLIQQNTTLVDSLVVGAQARQEVMMQLDALGLQEKVLQRRLQEYETEFAKRQKTFEGRELTDEEALLYKLDLEASLKRESYLRNQLSILRQKQTEVSVQLEDQSVDEQKANSVIVHQLYSWLKRHGNRKTGLVPSYEGDPKLENMSFTYDQALVVIAHSLFREYDSARKILSL